jgi:hypothetical protein
MTKSILKGAVAAAFCVPLTVQAALHEFTVTLNQQGEIDASSALDPLPVGKRALVPGVSSAFGAGVAQYNDVTNIFTFLSIGGTGLRGNITNQHIHLGAAGVSGGVLLGLPAPVFTTAGTDSAGTGAFSYFAQGLGTFPEASEAALLAGNTYINVHSSFDPTGEIRGQMVRVVPIPEPETYALMLAGLGLVGWVASRRRKAGV